MYEEPCQNVTRRIGVGWTPPYEEAPQTDGLSMTQQKALWALLENSTVAAAAAECGVSKRTLFRWLNDPGFVTAHRKLQSEFVTQAHAALQGLTASAVDTLRTLMNDPKVPAGTRVSAARAALTLAYELIQAEQIESRLERLDKRTTTGDEPYPEAW